MKTSQLQLLLLLDRTICNLFGSRFDFSKDENIIIISYNVIYKRGNINYEISTIKEIASKSKQAVFFVIMWR